MKQMSYTQFLTFVREQSVYELEEPSEYQATINHIVKNNAVELDGLCLRKNGETIAPTVYLNSYYEQYLEGRAMKDILQEIVETVHIDTPRLNVPASCLDNFEEVRDSIFYRVVNYELNKEQLENCPYIPYCDLAITFRWLVHADHYGVASSLVTNREIETWNVSAEVLFELASANTSRLFPAQIQPLEDLIQSYYEDLFNDSSDMDQMFSPINLHVLSNIHQISGATCMIYKDILSDFAYAQDRNLYILPSSIHEVLLLPDENQYDEYDLLNLVKEANSTVVEATDFLSNNIYYYDRNDNKITLIDHSDSNCM